MSVLRRGTPHKIANVLLLLAYVKAHVDRVHYLHQGDDAPSEARTVCTEHFTEPQNGARERVKLRIVKSMSMQKVLGGAVIL